MYQSIDKITNEIISIITFLIIVFISTVYVGIVSITAVTII